MREGVRVREISNEEDQRLLRIVRRSSGSVVTWRRAQMVLLSAQVMDVAQIAKVAFTSEDRVRAVLQNFNDDGFDSLYPRYAGGRRPTFTLPQRQVIKKIALARPQDHDLPFPTWSLAKLAEHLVAEGVVDDISLRAFGSCSERRACRSGHQDLQGEQRSGLRGQEEPGARALRHRRRQGGARRW